MLRDPGIHLEIFTSGQIFLFVLFIVSTSFTRFVVDMVHVLSLVHRDSYFYILARVSQPFNFVNERVLFCSVLFCPVLFCSVLFSPPFHTYLCRCVDSRGHIVLTDEPQPVNPNNDLGPDDCVIQMRHMDCVVFCESSQ